MPLFPRRFGGSWPEVPEEPEAPEGPDVPEGPDFPGDVVGEAPGAVCFWVLSIEATERHPLPGTRKRPDRDCFPEMNGNAR